MSAARPVRLAFAIVRTCRVLAVVAAVVLGGVASARAQAEVTPPKTLPAAGTSGTETSTPAPPAGQEDPKAQDPKPEDEIVFDPSEPDFTVITIPTTARLPRFKSAFRLTHRFTRPLGEGDFGDLVSNFFGLDSGARIGLEYRISLIRKSQIGIYRTSDKTIEFFGQYSLLQEGTTHRLSIEMLASIEGTNNFRDSYTPALGAVISKKLKTHGAIYLMPQWVNNANLLPSQVVDHNDSFVLGLGTRLRIRPTVYVVGEFTPRLAGDSPGVHYGSFGIEKRAGGHVFQLNFSNAVGTTPGQIARGGQKASDWYIGFNLSRKFF